jgi:hypothetical protein
MKTILISPLGTDLASRRSAALLRLNIQDILNSGDLPTVDLSHVKNISESYADEFFGILAFEHGLESISVLGAENSVLKEIAKAIRRRVTDEDVTKELSQLKLLKNNLSNQIEHV